MLRELLQKSFLYPYYVQIAKRIRTYYAGRICPYVYRRYVKNPMNPRKVLFLEIDGAELSDNFRLVYDRLQKTGDYELHSYCLRRSTRSVWYRGWLFLLFLRDLATARAVFLCEGTDWLSHVPIRKETDVTQLWHACGAFKRFGFSVGHLKFGASLEHLKAFPFHSHYTMVTVSSPEVVWAYEEAMGYPDNSGVILPTGVSRTDVFFDKTFLRIAKDRLLEKVPQAAGKRVLLYAPTVRGQVKYSTSPNVIDFDRLRTVLGDNSILLIKLHPFVKHHPRIPVNCRDFAFDVSNDLTIEELLCVSDLCISDYSSLVFEYSLFERPMVFFAHDLDDYYDWRGFYYDYETFVPGPIVKNNDELIEVLTHPQEYFDQERVRAFRQKFMSSCDGHATERILDRLGLLGMQADGGISDNCFSYTHSIEC